MPTPVEVTMGITTLGATDTIKKHLQLADPSLTCQLETRDRGEEMMLQLTLELWQLPDPVMTARDVSTR